jgi:hypothetical protein
MDGARRLLSGRRSNSAERGTNLLELRYEGCSVRGQSVLHLDKPSGDRALQVTLHCPVLFADVVERIKRRLGLPGSPMFPLRDGTRVSGYRAHDTGRRPSCGLVDERAIRE